MSLKDSEFQADIPKSGQIIVTPNSFDPQKDVGQAVFETLREWKKGESEKE